MGCANTSADEVLLFFDDMQSDIYCPFLSPPFIRRSYFKDAIFMCGRLSVEKSSPI